MKIRKLVTLYNEAVNEKVVDLEAVKVIDELLTDQREWELKNWNQGFVAGAVTITVGLGLAGIIKFKVL